MAELISHEPLKEDSHYVTRTHTSHLAATRSTQHSPDRFIRHAVIPRDVTERFSLLDTLEHGGPCRGRDLPARIRDGLRVGKVSHQHRSGKGSSQRKTPGRGSTTVVPRKQ